MHSFSNIEEGRQLEKAEKAAIFLHGRGGTAAGIIRLADEFCDESFYITAPEAPGNSWYPESFLKPVHLNEPWLSHSIDRIGKLVDYIEQFVPIENIYIIGFSQGACLSLEYAARNPRPFKGLAAFSGGLIGQKIDPSKYTGNLGKTRIFIGNSDIDPYIPIERAKESAGVLISMGADVMMNIYPGMDHTISPEEINDARNFLFQ